MGLVKDKMHLDFPYLKQEQTIREALESVRAQGAKHKIIYFYVLSSSGELVGVLPSRLLLTSPLSIYLKNLMINEPLHLAPDMSLHNARKVFADHKFLALPVCDQNKKLVGVLDIEAFAGDLGAINNRTGFDDVYELLGLSGLDQMPLNTKIKKRFSWLIATMCAGFLAALLTSTFETTLSVKITLTFFMTLILGLNEALSMQSTSLSIQRLHGNSNPNFSDLKDSILIETKVALPLALSVGLTISLFAYFWTRDFATASILILSLTSSLSLSALTGHSVPFLLHKLKQDTKLAAAPIALAISDLIALTLYFAIAKVIIG